MWPDRLAPQDFRPAEPEPELPESDGDQPRWWERSEAVEAQIDAVLGDCSHDKTYPVAWIGGDALHERCLECGQIVPKGAGR
ncbi:hypothetical protein AWB94_28445 [Mycolicibacterium canariasense]|nr:hypothetical protein AWB94_28445 [Mycolicibacterium canariasense]